MLIGGAGGLGLLACVACCSLPILGAIGVGTGAMAFFEVLEPLSAGLIALGAIAAVIAFVRLRRKTCATRASQGTSCAADGSCGCGPVAERLSGAAER
jgi:mercuric ion transport protein